MVVMAGQSRVVLTYQQGVVVVEQRHRCHVLLCRGPRGHGPHHHLLLHLLVSLKGWSDE